MEVIAKTNGGLLIQATENELKEILNAVTGVKPEKIEIGQKIPAIDYATTITKVKALKSNYDFQSLVKEKDDFVETFNKLQAAVYKAALIEV